MIPPRDPAERLLGAVFARRPVEDPSTEEQKIEMTSGRRHRDGFTDCEYPTRSRAPGEARCIRPAHHVFTEDDED